jgi:hypothetical protein
MGNKLYLIAGLAVGYVIGTAAGREQFNKLKGAVNDVLGRPEVKDALGKADSFVAEKAPGLHDIGGAVVDATAPGSPS